MTLCIAIRKTVISEEAAVGNFWCVMQSFYMGNFGAQCKIKDIFRAVPLDSFSCNLNSGHYKH